jgi:glycosyltransferase involved in cell wall biosynthesis
MSKRPHSNHKPSICFVALDNFAALMDNPQYGHIGGAEIQQAIVGRSLAKRGYRVSFITLDHGQGAEIEIDTMRILKAYDPSVGIRILRFLHPRCTHLWGAMSEADADIYYQRTQDSITGIVAAFCRWHHKKFVFAVAHDYDCISDARYFPQRHARVLYHYGLRRANLVIAQTITQQRLLRRNFGIDSDLIPNCAPDYGASMCDVGTNRPARGSGVLWIGAFKSAKRLELLLDVAEQLGGTEFDVVGDGDRESKYVQGLLTRAEAMPSVRLHGNVPHEGVKQFYHQAAVLVCTSRAEGFPNIFLEAWAQGLPVVSTFDPDDLIARKNIGFVAPDVAGLVSGVRTFLSDPDRWQRTSEAARQYYLENHTVDAVMPRYEKVFREIVNPTQKVTVKK